MFAHLYGMRLPDMLDLDLPTWQRFRAFADRMLGVKDG